jgi:hypothetical protein
MQTLTITRESDFSEVEVEFPEMLIQLGKEISKIYSKWPMIPTEEGEIKILVEDGDVDRHEREITGKGKYIITIKKY